MKTLVTYMAPNWIDTNQYGHTSPSAVTSGEECPCYNVSYFTNNEDDHTAHPEDSGEEGMQRRIKYSPAFRGAD